MAISQRDICVKYKNNTCARLDLKEIDLYFSKIFFESTECLPGTKKVLRPCVVLESSDTREAIYRLDWSEGNYDLTLKLVVKYFYNSCDTKTCYMSIVSDKRDRHLSKRTGLIKITDECNPDKYREVWSTYSSKREVEWFEIKDLVLINNSHDFDRWNFLSILNAANKLVR